MLAYVKMVGLGEMIMSELFGIYNCKYKLFQFPSIKELSKKKALNKLFDLIGYDACKYRFSARKLPEDVEQAYKPQPREPKIYIFRFGQYKGYKITEVFEKDKQYLYWCKNNIKNNKLQKEINKILDTHVSFC